LNGDETLASFLYKKELYISVISEIELFGYGKLKAKEKRTLKEFIQDSVIIDLTTEIKDFAIEIRKQYNVKLGDSIIAATALHTCLPFVTSDTGFNKIKGIDLVLYVK